MNDDSAIRHRRRSELFLRAAELPPDERDAFLDEQCGDDEPLRREIEEMLAHDRSETAFLDRPALGEAFRVDRTPELDEPPARRPGVPETIGNYRILSVLGEGGMGVVYRAEQINPKRTVALKVLRLGPGMGRGRDAIRRFELEAQVLARLSHPNIAHIYEAGTFEAGGTGATQPFLAMELVDGLPLPEHVRKHSHTVQQRIELFLQVCDAVEHAHQRGVIHRDLKPGNILVANQSPAAPVPGNLAAQPKVLDFGIARVTADDWQVSLITGTGQLLGTLAYMGPEQFEVGDVDSTSSPGSGDSGDFAGDTRTDVYSLGVVLFELLTGALPYDLHAKSLAQSLAILREREPKRIEQVDPEFRARGWNDLSVIVAKALEPDRHRRYGSVGEFAADLRRFLTGEPIMARPQTALYQLRKFARRHTELVGGVAAVFVLLVLGIVGLTKYAVDISRAKAAAEAAHLEAVAARDEARERSEELQEVADFQSAMLRDIDVHLMGLRMREDLLDEFRAFHARSDAIEELQREFERSLTGINFTTAAQKGLERNVFDRALAAIERDLADQPLIKARLLQSIADSLDSLDLRQQALATQVEALAIRRELLGDDHPDTLTSLVGLGYMLHGAARFEEAAAHYNEALEGRRKVLGEDHPDTLLVMRRMANLYWMTGRANEAVEAGLAALEGLRRGLGDDDLRTIDALHTMGPLMHGVGDFDAALAYTEWALNGRRRVLGDDHPETMISLNNMGVILMTQGRIEDAMPYLEEALERRTRILGRNHRLTLQSMANLARGLSAPAIRRYEEAELMTRDALEAYVKMYGEEHPHSLSTMANLGGILLDTGRLDEAEPFVMRSLELRRRAPGMGDRHPDTLTAFAPALRLLREAGRLDEATSLGDEAIALVESALPAGHMVRGFVLAEYGRTLALIERFDEAERMMLDSHRIMEGVFGQDHARTKDAARMVGEFYEAWGEADSSVEVDAKLAAWRGE